MNSITILDTQPDFVIALKNANHDFHDEGHLGEGFFNQLKTQLAADELYPVHRLDKITSGIIIVARNKVAAQQFQTYFVEQKINKFYLAISDKKPKKKQGLIKGDMVKSRRSAWKLMRTTDNPAVSQFFSYGVNNHRLFIIKPYTGKTHQIRVALNSIGSPIVGDPIYHVSSKSDRGYLHAFHISFMWNNMRYQYQYLPDNGELFTSTEIQHKIQELIIPEQLPWPKVK